MIGYGRPGGGAGWIQSSARRASFEVLDLRSEQPHARIRENAMAFQTVPDGALAVLVYGAGAQEWTNTFYFKKANYIYTDQEALATLMWNWSANNLMPWLSGEATLKKVLVYDMRAEGQPVVEFDAGTVLGGRTGTMNAVNATLVVTLRTALRGRSYRGRSYVSGFSENDADAFQVHAAAVTAGVEAAYQDIGITVAAQSWQYCVCSRFNAGVQRPTALLTGITLVELRSSVYGSQRRRLERP